MPKAKRASGEKATLPNLVDAIRSALGEKGTSITDLAASLGFERSTVANWLAVGRTRSGIPREHLGRLLEAVGIPYSNLEELRSRFVVQLALRSWAKPRATQTPGYVQDFFDDLMLGDVYFLAFVDRWPVEWANVLSGGMTPRDTTLVVASATAALKRGAHFLYLAPAADDWDIAARRLGGWPHQPPVVLCTLWRDRLPEDLRARVHFIQPSGTSLFSIGDKLAGTFRLNRDGSMKIRDCNKLVLSVENPLGGGIVEVADHYLPLFEGVLERMLKERESQDVLHDERKHILSVLPSGADSAAGASA